MAENTKLDYVGVYGTLKRGYLNFNAYLSMSRFAGYGTAPGIMIHLNSYPMLLEQDEEFPIKKNAQVSIEIYEVTQSALAMIDRLEGYPTFYDRVAISNNAFGKVWVYYGHSDTYLRNVRRVIWNGEWIGPHSPSIEVDFRNGNEKPHFLAKADPGAIYSIPNGSVCLLPDKTKNTLPSLSTTPETAKLKDNEIIIPPSELLTGVSPEILHTI